MKPQPRPLTSSLGMKYLMSLTGLALTGFVIVHMAGNLLVFVGPDALNSYAHGLKSKPALLWTARTGLLAVFLLHLVLAIRLRYLNALARPTRYVYEDTLQASWASRHMMLTGLVLLAFIVYHLAQFTFGVVPPAAAYQSVNGEATKLAKPKNYLDLAEVRQSEERYMARPEIDLRAAESANEEAERAGKVAPYPSHMRQDVYSMVISGFRNPWVTASYLIAMAFLGLHLWHGGSSWLQSLGLNAPGYDRFIRWLGPVLAVLLFAGNCSMPIAVLMGIVH